MKGSLIILFFFCSGALLARLGLIPTYLIEHDCTVYALWLLMLLVGISSVQTAGLAKFCARYARVCCCCPWQPRWEPLRARRW